uniref:Uncharacterized protein n=1 Tax=Lactuca sativa TaxID=4236 RepID=A0A9R1W4D3_LACSA|nr:hypothetical protein LSAT_V11C300154070 [Lactuca sativa]
MITVAGVSAGYGIMCTCEGSLYTWELSSGAKVVYLTHYKGATVSCLMVDDSGSSGVFAVTVGVKNDLGPSENTHGSNGGKRSYTLVRGRACYKNQLLQEKTSKMKLKKDLYHKKSETKEKLKEQKEIVKSFEKEIDCGASSKQEQFLFSLEGITDDLKRVSSERDQLCEQVNSLKENLEMMSEENKIYVEQKDEEIKILENFVEELDSTINVLEKRVKEMEDEIQRQHKIRYSFEVELQSLKTAWILITVTLTNMSIKLQGLDKYISELVIHAEAQALQYQQKYKSLEAMVSLMKTGPSKSSSEAQLLEKSENSLVKGRMNTEKDQELSLAKARLYELESITSIHVSLSLSNIAVASKLFAAMDPDQQSII